MALGSLGFQAPASLNEVLALELSPPMWELALTHRSFAYEHGGLPTNERLEFLGDSVLGLIVTDALFRAHASEPEGQLARMRAAVVNARSLAEVARTIDLGQYIRLGKGECATGGSDKSSILSDTMEAVIGAVYVESGLDAARALVHRLFDPVMADAAELGAGLDWKSSLQELAAVKTLGPPEYRVDQSGPPHDRVFEAAVSVSGRVFGPGVGRSKKEAEHIAAAAAWKTLSAEPESVTAPPD